MATSHVEISLDRVRSNYRKVALSAGANVMGVVKADAYGHGLVEVGMALADEGIKQLAVFDVEAACRLRAAGVKVPVLILGPTDPAAFPDAMESDAMVSIFDESQIEFMDSLAQRMGRRASVQVCIDTGMGREGIRSKRWPSVLASIRSRRGLKLTGVWSHFSDAEKRGDGRTQAQIERFRAALSASRRALPGDVQVHIANSAGVLTERTGGHPWCRVGISLYGIEPVQGGSGLNLSPAMSFYSSIAQVRGVYPGERVGYGATWRSCRHSRVATVPVGYADGVTRVLSNRGFFLVRGRRAPIVGMVSMNVTNIDVTEIPEAKPGDRVTIFGEGEGGRLAVDEVAEWSGTIPYEVVCRVGQMHALRGTRRFVQGIVEEPKCAPWRRRVHGGEAARESA